MAKELAVAVWCDPCRGDGHQEEATHRNVFATGTRWPAQALISHLWSRHAIKLKRGT